jgi:signal transduction histidine kinase
LNLEISSKEKKGTVILRFKDNGIGMDLLRYGNNLFKPFKRFSTKAEGKGIGLHIIKSMIEKNGGRIEVKSEINVGTEFICYLKVYKTATS